MKPRIISTLALTILLSSCAAQKYGWGHPTNNEAQFHSDKARCRYVAALSSGSYAPNNPGYQTAFGKALADRMDINSRRAELVTYCMQSLGYVWAAID